MNLLFEYRGSRRQLTVAGGETVTSVVSEELRSLGRRRAQVFTSNDAVPSGGERSPDIYLLQKWSTKWECYVDVTHPNELADGDKLAVIAKPKLSSNKLLLLCCCGGASSYSTGKVGRSGKNIVPKTEEIQSIDYQFRVESEVTFEWEDTNSIAPSESAPRATEDGEHYIRSGSGRASWKLVDYRVLETGNGDDATSEHQNEGVEGMMVQEEEGTREIQSGEIVDEAEAGCGVEEGPALQKSKEEIDDKNEEESQDQIEQLKELNGDTEAVGEDGEQMKVAEGQEDVSVALEGSKELQEISSCPDAVLSNKEGDVKDTDQVAASMNGNQQKEEGKQQSDDDPGQPNKVEEVDGSGQEGELQPNES